MTKRKDKAKKGRPSGSRNKRTQFLEKVSQDALQAGVMPIEVMLSNMRFYHGEAGKLIVELQEKKQVLEEEEVVEDQVEALRDLAQVFAKLSNTRMLAQQCAVEAAPYCHPKLANVRVAGSVKHEFGPIDEDKMTPHEAQQSYLASLRDDPMTLDLVATEVLDDDEDLNSAVRRPRLRDARGDTP